MARQGKCPWACGELGYGAGREDPSPPPTRMRKGLIGEAFLGFTQKVRMKGEKME